MCITLDDSKMTGTIVGAAVNYKRKTHILLYKNTVQNLSGNANALVLPIMGKILKVSDTTPFNNFMDEIVQQLTQTRGAKSAGRSMSIKTYKVGSYTVLEAENTTPNAILKEIAKLPATEQPVMKGELLKWYKDHYNNPTLLLCCFTGSDTLSSQPIMVEYEPRNFNSFLLPGADDHHGEIPKLGTKTDRDHKVIFGQVKKPTVVLGGNTIQFSQEIPKSLQNGIWEINEMPGYGTNCDWVWVKDETSFTWSLKEVTTKKEIAALF